MKNVNSITLAALATTSALATLIVAVYGFESLLDWLSSLDQPSKTMIKIYLPAIILSPLMVYSAIRLINKKN